MTEAVQANVFQQIAQIEENNRDHERIQRIYDAFIGMTQAMRAYLNAPMDKWENAKKKTIEYLIASNLPAVPIERLDKEGLQSLSQKVVGLLEGMLGKEPIDIKAKLNQLSREDAKALVQKARLRSKL